MLPSLPGCGHVCPNDHTQALTITVTSETTAVDVCNATVTATLRSKTIALQDGAGLATGTCCCGDVAEPLLPIGAYTTGVTAPGFQAATVYTSIQLDDCGADIHQDLTVMMKPAS